MRKLLTFLALTLAIVVGGAAGALVLVTKRIDTPLEPGAPSQEFVVARGASARAVGDSLQAEGFIENKWFWRYHLWRRGGLQVKAGRFPLSRGMTLPAIATALEGAPLPEDEPFAMIEGWRLRDADKALAAVGWITPGAYVRAATGADKLKAPFPLPAAGLEGYLYPETYRVVPGRVDVDKLLQRQLDTFVQRFYEPYRDEIAKSGRTLHDLVIMASMLEREEPVPAQRPLVAGILWKRIDHDTALGVDATSRYELDEWNDRQSFLKKLRDKEDPYNTRHRVGLPPGPIGAPSVASLVAALRPKPSEFWYYLHDANKVLRPSRNAAEHEALRKKYNVY
ncbi:MAG: endolytic transglycosylase MltG [Myxococcota bacterium]